VTADKELRMAVYTLPDLPYDYSALEPAMTGEIMELHHDKPAGSRCGQSIRISM
jgi:hypothetical protein